MCRRIVALVLCTMIMSIMFAGCTKEKETNDQQAKDNYQTEKASNDTESTNTKEDIQICLEKDENVDGISWSKDNTQVAYTKDTGDLMKDMYIWKVGEKEKKVKGLSGPLYDITWSFDNKYITINEQTSNIYKTIIISAEDLLIVDEIGQIAAGPIWSLDSEKIAFAMQNDKEPIIDIEASGTTDLMIYEISKNRKIVVLEADNDFFYSPLVWDENGLKYEKSYFDDRKTEELIYGETIYDIVTKTYTEKTENIEVETKYPVVTNMENKDVENKINNMILEKIGIQEEPIEIDDETFKETIQGDYEITLKTKNRLSIKFSDILYMEGAAHPSRYIYSLTFDFKTGNILKLKDLFKENVDYKNKLNTILSEKVNKLDFKLFEEYKGIEEKQEFYMIENSLVVYYQEGIYTPHAVGPLFLEVAFDEIKNILK